MNRSVAVALILLFASPAQAKKEQIKVHIVKQRISG